MSGITGLASHFWKKSANSTRAPPRPPLFPSLSQQLGQAWWQFSRSPTGLCVLRRLRGQLVSPVCTSALSSAPVPPTPRSVPPRCEPTVSSPIPALHPQGKPLKISTPLTRVHPGELSPRTPQPCAAAWPRFTGTVRTCLRTRVRYSDPASPEHRVPLRSGGGALGAAPRSLQVSILVPDREDAPWRPRGSWAESSGSRRGRSLSANLDVRPRPGDRRGLPAPPLPWALSVWRCPAARGWWNEARSRQKTKSAGHLAGSEWIMQRKSGNVWCVPGPQTAPPPRSFFFLSS